MRKAEDEFIEEATDNKFDYWLNRPNASAELRQELAKETVLIVPRGGIRDVALRQRQIDAKRDIRKAQDLLAACRSPIGRGHGGIRISCEAA